MDSKIKLVYIVNNLKVGGGAKVVMDICSFLDPSRYQVTVLSLSGSVEYLTIFPLPSDVTLKIVGYKEISGYRLWDYVKLLLFRNNIRIRAEEVMNILTSIRPDVVHFHTHFKELLLGIFLKEQIDCELIFTEHTTRNVLPRLFYKRILLVWIFRYLYRYYHLIAVSKNVEQVFRSYKLIGRNKLEMLIENSVDLKKFFPVPRENKGILRVVYVARLSVAKGHQDLIRAWKKLSHIPEKKLLLVGPDDMNGELQKLVLTNFGTGSIEFLGVRDDIPELLNNADIAVFPSYKEGLPLALLEKMAMALPVVASDINEIRSIITDNQDGLLFKLGDIEDLAQKLEMLIRDQGLRKRLGQNARETILKRYGKGVVAQQNEEFYQRILSKRRIN